MAPRAIWKGRIHFGSVDVPVRLHIAVKEERIRFHLLHTRDRARLKQQMVCAYEKKAVSAEEQASGFEVEEGKYILVDPAELEETEPEESRLIEVHEFVTSGEIDPVFLERVYYLEPDTSSRAYSALVGVMTEMDVHGICTWTMRKRTYLGALQAHAKMLRLNTLRYADEVIPVKALRLPALPLSEKELEVGSDLINHLAAPFEPGKFENEHEKKLRSLIDKKARGESIAILRPRRLKPTKSDKLLEALEASLKRVA